MRLRPLPAPDVLEFELPDGHVIVLVDDGSACIPVLVDRFQRLNWPVVIMRSSPASTLLVDTPVVLLEDASETALSAAIDNVRESYGPIAGCVVVWSAPQTAAPSPSDEVAPASVGDDLTGLTARDGVRLSFLLAKHLHAELTAAAEQGWGGFFVVTQLDGTLGYTGAADRLPATAGLTGLTKTLRLEWPTVACRTIDLAPTLTSDTAADAVIGEMLDPNRSIGEVGWGSEGRVTVTADLGAGIEERDDGV